MPILFLHLNFVAITAGQRQRAAAAAASRETEARVDLDTKILCMDKIDHRRHAVRETRWISLEIPLVVTRIRFPALRGRKETHNMRGSMDSNIEK